jgi:tetratricopeptide (TPR) repeat protein
MNPELKRGHMYYIDHLIADERLDEAHEVLKSIQSIEDNYIISWYQGKIEKAKGNHETAIEHFNDMVKREPDNWLSYSTRADEFARLGFYDQALKDNKKAFELQPHPKYIDSQECRAIIYEFLDEPKKAIEMWMEAQKVLKSDWNITFGRIYDGTDSEIRRLEQLI